MHARRKPKVTIRTMKAADIPGVIRVCNQAFIELARRTEFFQRMLPGYFKNPNWNFVAIAGNSIVGFLMGTPRENQLRANVNLIAILPDRQYKGIGTLLMDTLEEKARKAGFTSLTTGTPFAKGFYVKNGYGPTRTNYKMIKDLVQKLVPAPRLRQELVDINLDNLERVLKGLPDEQAEPLLRAFTHAGDKRYVAMKAAINHKTAGAVCGFADSIDGDLVTVSYLYGRDVKTRLMMIRVFEHACSQMGIRRVGIAADNDAWAARLEGVGYQDTGYDFWNTLYFMRKELE